MPRIVEIARTAQSGSPVSRSIPSHDVIHYRLVWFSKKVLKSNMMRKFGTRIVRRSDLKKRLCRNGFRRDRLRTAPSTARKQKHRPKQQYSKKSQNLIHFSLANLAGRQENQKQQAPSAWRPARRNKKIVFGAIPKTERHAKKGKCELRSTRSAPLAYSERGLLRWRTLNAVCSVGALRIPLIPSAHFGSHST